MRHELRRVDALRAANIGALVYGLLMTAFALIFSPFFLLASLVAPAGESAGFTPFIGIFMLVFYPILGVVMGWLSGLLTSAIYNLVVRWTGGLLVEFDVPAERVAGWAAGPPRV